MGGAAAAATLAVTKAKDIYDYNKDRRKTKKNLIGLKTQKNMEINSAKNLLERNLAARKAKISSMGLVNSSSALAAKKRLKTEGLMDIAKTEYDYKLRENDLLDKFRDRRDEFVFNSLLKPQDQSNSNKSPLSLLNKK